MKRLLYRAPDQLLAMPISVGERSRFGHPHEVVLERYVSRGVRLLQTGRDGTVTIESDGASLTVSTYRAE